MKQKISSQISKLFSLRNKNKNKSLKDLEMEVGFDLILFEFFLGSDYYLDSATQFRISEPCNSRHEAHVRIRRILHNNAGIHQLQVKGVE